MATLTPHQALCKKDAEGLDESYARSVLDFPLLDGCNQEVIDDVDGWHDDCYLPSDAPWQFTSPNANYVNSDTMQTHCIWLVNPGNPTAAPRPIKRVSQVPSLVPENPTVVAPPPPAMAVESAVRTLSKLSQPQIPSSAGQSLIPSNALPHTQEPSSMLSTPILIVIVVGVCLLLALVVAALLLWRCRKLRQRAHRISGSTSNNRHVKIEDALDGDIPMSSTTYSGSTAGGTSETVSSARSPQLHRTHTEATSDHFSILNQETPRQGQQITAAEKDSSEKQGQKDFETEPPYLWTVDQTANWASRIPEIGDQVERLVRPRHHGRSVAPTQARGHQERAGTATRLLEKEISQLMCPPIYSQK
ncbi:hypothetical protein BJ741DRAFT_667283 [Chytriomyces cf. hyalinus JEL632]|nr:hypothetical protein BJ741DRAFT_667283 [Chytriomyces cf. hyalinus JEL632]